MSNATADKILRAADELFCERGYEGVSAADIARRARVKKALVFYHFGSKAELFDCVLDRYYEAHRAALAEAFCPQGRTGDGEEAPAARSGAVSRRSFPCFEGDFAARIRRVLEAYLDFMDANARYPRLVQQEVARAGGHLAKVRRNLEALFEWAAGALEPVTPRRGPLAAKHFFLTFSGIVINYYTYAPAFEGLWGEDPMSPRARAERRAHVLWVLETLLARLLAEGTR